MSFKETYNQFEKGIQFQPVKGKPYLVQKNKYIVNQWIIKSAIILLGIFFLWLSYTEFGFDYKPEIAFKCDVAQGCANPFYEGCKEGTIQCSGLLCSTPKYQEALKELCSQSWSNDAWLHNGFKYGKEPSVFYQYKGLIAIAIMGFALLINHLIYNRRKQK